MKTKSILFIIFLLFTNYAFAQQDPELIIENNFDIYILNFDLPTDNIQKNAELVENVIDYLNGIKSNKTELVIAGGSMGGLVTRVAITQMEQNNEDIQTRLWFSFDSPQKGANIPLGLQYWIQELNNSLYVAGGFLEKLRSKAAKQMMLYHFDDYPNTSTERINFVQLLENQGMPQTCRNIAITNGASDGSSQGYTDGTKLIHITWKVPLARRRYIYAWAVQNGGGDFVVCKKVKVKNNGDEILMKEYKANNTMPLDAAPGGFRPSMKEIGEMNTYGLAEITPYEDNHAFIPAVSSLGLDVTQLDEGYYYKIKYDPNLLNKTPFDMVFFPNLEENKSINQEHVWVSFETANNIFDEIIPFDIVMGDDPDWQTGEIMAENSIHLTSGFHGSADEEIHLHLDQIDRTILVEEDYVPDTKNIKQSISPKNSAQIIETNHKIDIYPNPTTGTFIIANDTKQTIKSIEISDLSGKIVHTEQNLNNNYIEINISNLEQGIYLIKITTKEQMYTRKIIKL